MLFLVAIVVTLLVAISTTPIGALAPAVDNHHGIAFRMASGNGAIRNVYQPVCTAVAVQTALASFGQRDIDIDEAMARSCNGTPIAPCSGGRRTRHAAEAAQSLSALPLRRHHSRARSLDELAHEMRGAGSPAGIVAVDAEGYNHTVAIIVDPRGYSVVDITMYLAARWDDNVANWDGGISSERGGAWYFTVIALPSDDYRAGGVRF